VYLAGGLGGGGALDVIFWFVCLGS
jgi:hypothetical protein